VILGERITLIDFAVRGYSDMLFEYIRDAGRDPSEISLGVFTHAHPDHIGGALSIRDEVGCEFAAHGKATAWIEDVDRQFRERPVPGFHEIVESWVPVDRMLRDGDTVEIGDGTELQVIHTPGHSPGQIALFHPGERALFCADAVPVAGGLPIYTDAEAAIASIRRLQMLDGVDVLLSSWDDPRHGAEVAETLRAGIEYMQRLHQLVRQQQAEMPEGDVRAVTAGVIDVLGLPAAMVNPLLMASIKAHMEADDTVING
jgi:glyoxylase-like metal-dependent hydrolase (beta-lactamase superfamily II)